MKTWRGLILGPEETPYEDGIFEIQISIPDDYPFAPPHFKFITKIFHPNISSSGGTCIDILSSNWAPSHDLLIVVQLVQALLGNPNFENGFPSEESTKLYKSKGEAAFNAKAKEMTYEYAIKTYK